MKQDNPDWEVGIPLNASIEVCGICRASLAPNANFCESCGTKVASINHQPNVAPNYTPQVSYATHMQAQQPYQFIQPVAMQPAGLTNGPYGAIMF